jgi:hypothetical protein
MSIKNKESKEKLIITVICTPILEEKFLGKFISLFNYIFEKYYDSKAFFESFEGGFITFLENQEAFKVLFTPFPTSYQRKINKKPIIDNFLSTELSESDVPAKGLYFNFDFSENHFTDDQLYEDFLTTLENFFSPIHNSITVKLDLPHIKILFPNWEAFKNYADLLAHQYAILK